MFAIIMLFVLQFTKNKDAYYGYVTAWVNTGFTVLFCLLCIVQLVINLWGLK